MGWCHEFGPQIHEGCGHSMVAGIASCQCPECGITCEGRFAGCGQVWAKGSKLVSTRRDRLVCHPEEVRTNVPVHGTNANTIDSGSDTTVTAGLRALNGKGRELITLRTDTTSLAATVADTTVAARRVSSERSNEAGGSVLAQIQAIHLLMKDMTLRLERIEDRIANFVSAPPSPPSGQGRVGPEQAAGLAALSWATPGTIRVSTRLVPRTRKPDENASR